MGKYHLRTRWARHVAHMGVIRNAYRILVRKPVGKRPCGRARNRWEDVQMDHREIGWRKCGMDASGLG
jgi:hypothetical protein